MGGGLSPGPNVVREDRPRKTFDFPLCRRLPRGTLDNP